MRRFIVLLVAVLIGFSGMSTAAQDYDYGGQAETLFEIVVELDAAVDPTTYQTWYLGQLGVDMSDQRDRFGHVYQYALNGFSVWLTPLEIGKSDRLLGDGQLIGVRAVTRSTEVHLPVITDVEGQMPESRLTGGQVIPTGIQRIYATTGATFDSVDVAVIDTGVDAKHPDLNVVGGKDCTVRGAPEQWGIDGYGHGTHVAGTIAAKDNNEGVVGVAPGARIWSVKVLDDTGSGTTASVICGLDWVAQNTNVIDVANMSLGGGGSDAGGCQGDDPMHTAICRATEKTIFVVAAGNSSTDASSFVPASYDEVLTVSAYADFDGQQGSAGAAPDNRCSAMSVDDERAAFSNFGADVDIAAPGTCILSTLPGGAYGLASGTSMASPHVAGAVARFLAENPDQRAWARQQLFVWSAANTGPIPGDPDGPTESLLFVGVGIPRYEGEPNPPPGQDIGIPKIPRA